MVRHCATRPEEAVNNQQQKIRYRVFMGAQRSVKCSHERKGAGYVKFRIWPFGEQNASFSLLSALKMLYLPSSKRVWWPRG